MNPKALKFVVIIIAIWLGVSSAFVTTGWPNEVRVYMSVGGSVVVGLTAILVARGQLLRHSLKPGWREANGCWIMWAGIFMVSGGCLLLLGHFLFGR